MVELEIDGRKVEVAEGSMVMHAASELDIYIPHFCYHKKLSIAANCRMCLVEVEKAPKPLPACATPVSNGMKVFTRSERAIKAQKGVMEFLLINHPLDCPICDQGGECQLQDLAVGYGGSSSRYDEPKRVVFHKQLGPLISAEEMTRCIHCTRCVRFGQEVAGVMELGMAGRGEHSEIMSFVGRSVDSELSGNMIDVCPVGALTSKPFRYSARTWELVRRRSIAPHDSLGSNLVIQVKNDRVMRALPLENEAINECWLSDRDRFAYEGLNSPQRLLQPMVKQDGHWRVVDWTVALEYASHALQSVRTTSGPGAIGALGSGQSTVEELYLLGRLMRGLGAANVDFRLRQTDFSLDGTAATPWLGMKIAELGRCDQVLLIGSFLRKDHPLLAARLRVAARHGARVSVVHAVDDDLLMPVAARAIAAPSQWPATLAAILCAALQAADKPVPAELSGITVSESARAVAAQLVSGEHKAVLLGNGALYSRDLAQIAALAQAIAEATGAVFGYLGDSANFVGGHLAGAVPFDQGGLAGKNAREMVEQPLTAYVLLNVEPSLDHAQPAQARRALAAADSVIALSAYDSPELRELADCLLPITPFTETGGSFVNCEGTVQSFNGVVRAAGEARPAWKVLRVLGNLLAVDGFGFDSVEQVREQALGAGVHPRLGNRAATAIRPSAWAGASGAAERIPEVPIYSVDPIVRRAPSLQATSDARPPRVRASAATLAGFGLAAGGRARVCQGDGEVILEVDADPRVADGAVRLPSGHPDTAALERMTGEIRLEKN